MMVAGAFTGHPGVNTPALQARYRDWNFDWDAERNALLDPNFQRGLTRLGFQIA